MPDNQFTSSQPWVKKKDENNTDPLIALKEENQRISLENLELKKKLEKEKLFHSTLYKQWTELNARVTAKDHELEKLKSGHASKSPFYRYSLLGLLLITVILAVSAYNLSRDRDKTNNAEVQNIEQVSAPQSTTSASGRGAVVKNETGGSKTVTDPVAVNDLNNRLNNNETVSAPGTANGAIQSARYRVKTKTYFCNEPDASTRRNTFLLPDSTDYGVVNALDDRNGYIYIVFTNHAGRISKGWISKSDLEPLN